MTYRIRQLLALSRVPGAALSRPEGVCGGRGRHSKVVLLLIRPAKSSHSLTQCAGRQRTRMQQAGVGGGGGEEQREGFGEVQTYPPGTSQAQYTPLPVAILPLV